MVRVVTHNGTFHTDEVVACMLLKNFIEYGATIVRTRDACGIEQADVVVDVGKMYDHSLRMYDHHQASFQEKWSETSPTLLSSAGLVWKHYGKIILEKIMNTIDNYHKYTPEDLEALHSIVYYEFFQEIDANDNGVNQYVDPPQQTYRTNATLIGTISRLNGLDVYNEIQQQEHFERAMFVAFVMFNVHLESHIRNYFMLKEGREKMKQYFTNNRVENGRIIVIEEDINEWQRLLKELDTNEEVLFVVYPRNAEWGVRTISKQGFIARRDLAPENVLREAVGDELTFAHVKRFMASCLTKEAAITCASVSLTEEPNDELKKIK